MPGGSRSDRRTLQSAATPSGTGSGHLKLGRGVTEREITIGFNIAKNLDAAYAATGARGPDGPDTDQKERPIVEALVKYFNAHGGIRGRRIRAVFYEYDVTSTESWDAQAQAACEKFVRDERVFAVVSGHITQNDTLLTCLAAAKTPLIQQNHWPYNDTYWRDYHGYLHQPSKMRPERWGPAYVSGLKAAGFFDAGYKLGLLRFDAQPFKRARDLIAAALTEEGLRLTDEFVASTPKSFSDYGALASQMSAAVLRFRSRGITHVIFDEWSGQMPYFFFAPAQSQGYLPRLGFTSLNTPGYQQANASPEQLMGAITVGWLPGLDVYPTANDLRSGGAYALCLKIRRESGQPMPSRLYVGTHCDSLLYLRAALARATELTSSGLTRGAEGLGTSYDSPQTWSTRLGPGRLDGASAVRIARYQSGCECFRFDGGLRPVG